MNWFKEHIQTSPLFDTAGIVNDPSMLYPPFREKIRRLVLTATESGLSVGVFETYRSQKRQLALYKQRKTKIKINGLHHFGVAADIVFRTTAGGWTWTPMGGSATWKRLGQIGKDLGLVWGGDWKDFVDCPHFQGYANADLPKIIAGEYPPAPRDPIEYIPFAQRQPVLDARRALVRQLAPVYKIALEQNVKLSQETMAKLNAFRYSPELEKIKLEG